MKVNATAAFVLLSITAFPAAGAAQSELTRRARAADEVVVARVLQVDAVPETNSFGDQLIVTTAVLEVEETLKGRPEKLLTVKVEGGTIGDLTLEVSDLPTIKRGERATFFLDRTTEGVRLPHDRGAGILKLDRANRVEGSTLTLDDIKQAVSAGLAN